jgi:hypothetical protein
MTRQNELMQLIYSKLLWKRALIGAVIALVLVNIYVAGFGKYGAWIFWPISTVTVGGACGGIFYHLMDYVRQYGGWKKAAANILSVLVYILGLWLSLVAGLSQVGYWD